MALTVEEDWSTRRFARPCLAAGRLPSGATMAWEFERDGEVIKVTVTGPLMVRVGGTTDLLVDAAIAGVGIVPLVEDWLHPHFRSGALEPILQPGGSVSPGRISVILDGGLCRRHYGPLLISSRYRPAKCQTRDF
jgi:hypothetical protein